MLRPLVFTCIAAAMTLPATAADLPGTPRYGSGQMVEPAPLVGGGRYLAVESPPFDKVTTYSSPGGAPIQVYRYFGPPQVSHYYSHYGVPLELLVGRQQFGCNYRYC